MGDAGRPARRPPAPSANTVSGVTVTAEKPNPLINPASQFVRERLPQSANSEQYPRFRDDICVKVIGLPPEFAGFIAKRLTEVANEVHAPVARDAACVPNVHIVFTTNPQGQVDDIAKHKDILIGFHFTAQTKKVTTFDRPIQAWYVTRTRDATGNSWIEIANPCPIERRAWRGRLRRPADGPRGQPPGERHERRGGPQPDHRRRQQGGGRED